jgi:hypothetical protein
MILSQSVSQVSDQSHVGTHQHAKDHQQVGMFPHKTYLVCKAEEPCSADYCNRSAATFFTILQMLWD